VRRLILVLNARILDEYLDICKDSIQIKARMWLDKKDWREIHDILRVQGFNRLAVDKDDLAAIHKLPNDLAYYDRQLSWICV
jgi:hypothetical protein